MGVLLKFYREIQILLLLRQSTTLSCQSCSEVKPAATSRLLPMLPLTALKYQLEDLLQDSNQACSSQDLRDNLVCSNQDQWATCLHRASQDLKEWLLAVCLPVVSGLKAFLPVELVQVVCLHSRDLVDLLPKATATSLAPVVQTLSASEHARKQSRLSSERLFMEGIG